ncbi:uncharacterized protein Z520_04869 [Fonsecaea multimorphosa CBS 102226]|uniref:Cytochrome P450 n=1 Tax=Fonsecaea multimorphosa CBS 102226 TaxID=1442371 RepID=A0A0D2KRE8_9EURO|nr:uncharacterized protein Z520_04869 [Fonsecaea multimorphosa CBS 102226]KIX99293.1 hypothetical protein Z520_04869 [Fonsecaea multimorphosa CBS 102226]
MVNRTVTATSIFIYRVFFHRLRAFPGPFWARVTKLWTRESHLRGEYHRDSLELHHKYGDIVRVAPNELDINDLEAIKLIYGPGSKLYKGPWYDGPSATAEARSIQGTKDHAIHRSRRKVWSQGNSGSAMAEFEPLMVRHVDEFIEQIRLRKEVDIALWINFLSFDIMGDLTFDMPFNMVKSGETHHFMTTLRRFMKAVSMLSAIPWLNSLVHALPTDSAVKDLEEYSRDCFKTRKAQGSSRKDLFYYLLGEDQNGTKLTELGADHGLTHSYCRRLGYVIHRDGGLQRVVPPEGMELANKFIPGYTLVSVSP